MRPGVYLCDENLSSSECLRSIVICSSLPQPTDSEHKKKYRLDTIGLPWILGGYGSMAAAQRRMSPMVLWPCSRVAQSTLA